MVDDPDPVVREAKARVGNVLAKKYRLEKLLGIGGMAAVYLATHRNGNRVAIKILHREVSLDGEARSRFLLEGYTANKLDHPDTARVLDDEIAEDGSAFLVVELLEGETYEERAANRRLPHREVMEMAHALLDVLAAAADKGIVHRDIKPENLFHTTSGTLKVLDFGIARVGDTRMAQATRTGLVFGTPAFMPPEQALGKTKEIDHRTDIWASCSNTDAPTCLAIQRRSFTGARRVSLERPAGHRLRRPGASPLSRRYRARRRAPPARSPPRTGCR